MKINYYGEIPIQIKNGTFKIKSLGPLKTDYFSIINNGELKKSNSNKGHTNLCPKTLPRH
jgi:hypothetical protein